MNKKHFALAVLLLLFAGLFRTSPLLAEEAEKESALVSEGETSETEKSLPDLNGKKVGVTLGTLSDQIVQEYFPKASIVYMNAVPDLAAALDKGKIDAFIEDGPVARYVIKNYPDQYIAMSVHPMEYGFIMPISPQLPDLSADLNAYLEQRKADGTIKAMEEVWYGEDESLKVMDYDQFTGEKGTVRMVVATDMGAPFEYFSGGKIVGFEVDVIAHFCREYGYALEVSDTSFNGLLTGVASGKWDIGAALITITEERKQSIDFSYPFYDGSSVFVLREEGAAHSQQNLFDSLASSFRRTFIEDSRWKMFLDGIGVTLLITVLSVLFGSLIGFGAYRLYRKNSAPYCAVLNVLLDILQKMPVVVLLMVLFYVIFGKSDLSGFWVSIIGFTLLFSGTVIRLLQMGAEAVDPGQSEAALAMGYSRSQTYMKIIFPQSARFFLPALRGEIVSLIKETAIVGYISVQDLTRVSDLVRSRTYEAFFPLIVSAIIYYLLAWLLTVLVRRIEIKTDPLRRSPERILKGVQRK